MAPWPEDFSESTLEDVLRSQAENRAWGKELRLRTTTLVNSRLAKNISLDDYMADRARSLEDAVEYRRRAAILDSQIERRAAPDRPRGT